MKIRDIRIRYISLGKRHAPVKYGGSIGYGTWAIVEIFTDEGITGISRVRGRTGPGSSGDIIEHDLKLLIMGEDPTNPERLWSKMQLANEAGRAREEHAWMTAMGAVDIALWDIVGKAAGMPLYKLFGGYQDRLPIIAGWVYYPEAGDYSEELALIEKLQAEGYPAVKVHLRTHDPLVGVNQILDTRKHIGDGIDIALDLVDAKWRPWQMAKAIKGFEEANILWLEDCFTWEDKLGGLAFASSVTHIPITAGEHECSLQGWRDLITVGGVKILMLDLTNGGGFSQLNRAAHLAQAYNALVTTHGSAQPELGNHFIAAHSNGLSLSLLPPEAPVQEWSKVYKEPLVVEDGWTPLPQRPGLGMELNEDFIAHYQL